MAAKVARHEELLGELRETLKGYQRLQSEHSRAIEVVAGLQAERDALSAELEKQQASDACCFLHA